MTNLKGVTDAVRDVLSQSKTQIDCQRLCHRIILTTLLKMLDKMHTLQDKNKIITQHMQKIDPGEGQEFTNSNVTALNEVLKG